MSKTPAKKFCLPEKNGIAMTGSAQAIHKIGDPQIWFDYHHTVVVRDIIIPLRSINDEYSKDS